MSVIGTDQRLAPVDFCRTMSEGPRDLSPTRRALREWLLSTGAEESWIDDVLVATSEACTNALEHAYSVGICGPVEVRAVIVGGCLELVISDHGVWKEPLDRGNRGRGRNLMENLMDRAVIESGPDGTVVRMRKDLGRTA